MADSLQEFLRRKGAIGLLSLLHERPMTYSEIEPEIEVTSDTIVERRNEAADLGLLDISLGEDTGTKKVYHLTDMGEFVTDKMAREGLISNYRKMRILEELVDDQTNALVTWVSENPSQLLQFEDAQEGTIIRDQLQTDSATVDGTDSGDDEPEKSTSTTAEASGEDEDGEGNEVTEQEENSDESDAGNAGSEDREQPPTAAVEDHLEEINPSETSQGSLSDLGPGEPDDEETD